jgi:Ca-activated chloride channel family protein
MILPMTSASQKGVIESAIFPLEPDGSTNAAAGIRMGYEEALAKIDANAQNRVVLLSDGVANTGETDQNEITNSVRLHREKGIYLNTIGVG